MQPAVEHFLTDRVMGGVRYGDDGAFQIRMGLDGFLQAGICRLNSYFSAAALSATGFLSTSTISARGLAFRAGMCAVVAHQPVPITAIFVFVGICF